MNVSKRNPLPLNFTIKYSKLVDIQGKLFSSVPTKDNKNVTMVSQTFHVYRNLSFFLKKIMIFM